MTNKYVDFEPLLSLLGMQLNTNRQLLALAEEQRQSIITNDLEKLGSVVRRQTAQLSQLNALEKKRLLAVDDLQISLASPERAFTLGELIAYAPPNQQQSLHSLLEEFADLLHKLKEANDVNNMLLRTNIELNELMLNLLMDNIDPLNIIYCEDGSKAEAGPAEPSLFDQQV